LNLFSEIIALNGSEPSPESFQKGDLRFCRGDLRLDGGIDILKIDKNFTDL